MPRVKRTRAQYDMSQGKLRMKFFIITFFALFMASSAIAAPQVSSADSYAIEYNLGIIEGWRVAPDAVTRHCKTIDPDGIASRNENFEDWQQTNAELLARIKVSFEAAVPIVSPAQNSRVSPVEAVRAVIIVEALKIRFLGKNGEDAQLICRAYFSTPSLTNLVPVKKALSEVESWLESTK